jgi:hypothetical protein
MDPAPTAGPTSATAERRTAPRRQPAMGTVCRLSTGPGKQDAIGLVWNISTSGVSMLLTEPREPGTTLPGELQTVTGGHTLPVTMRVVHVKKLESGDYFLGAQFQRPLADDEMRPFVA